MRMREVSLAGLALLLAGCEGAGGGGGPVVARVGDVDLTADEVAGIVAPNPQIAAQARVVRSLADLWLDYFLLARAAAEDSTLQNVDVTPLVEQQVEQELVLELRDRVLQVDTAVSDAEVEALYREELPGARIRARHILVKFPEDPAPAQVDSVRSLVDSLRSRITAGEDFGEMAREYSQDPGSAGRAGELGFFGRGEMVRPFEDAAFALEPMEISQPVETPFGLHLIQVLEREIPSLDEDREGFRTRIRNRRLAEAESVYVADLMETAEVEVVGEGYESARQLAAEPGTSLSRRARNRALVRFRGGTLTLGDYLRWIRSRPAALTDDVRNADDEELGELFRNLARGELLVHTALEEGVRVEEARRDSIAAEAREGLRSVARQLELLGVERRGEETLEEAVDRAVHDILVQVVGGGRQFFPLGSVSYILRDQFGGEIFPSTFRAAVDRIREVRSAPPG